MPKTLDEILEEISNRDPDDDDRPVRAPRERVRRYYQGSRMLKKENRMTNYLQIRSTPGPNWWDDHPVIARAPDLDTVTEILLARAAPGCLVIQYSESKNIREGYKYSDVLSAVLELVPGVQEVFRLHDEDRPTTQDFWFPGGWMQLSPFSETSVSVNAVAVTGVLEPLMTRLGELLTTAPPVGTVYMMTSSASGPKFHAIGQGGFPLERGNYTPEVLEGYDRIREELRAPTPRGRLTIVDGPPGSGKTYIIRGLLQEVEKVVFVVVPPHFLPALGEPTALTALTKLRTEHEGKPIILVVEDADECLAPRDGANISAISAVLNLGDGIMGSLLDVRVLATTNAERQELDPAIRRPGRLSTALHVGVLSADEALEIYRRLLKTDGGLDLFLYGKTYMLAEVYQRAYDSGWKPAVVTRVRKMGFGHDGD